MTVEKALALHNRDTVTAPTDVAVDEGIGQVERDLLVATGEPARWLERDIQCLLAPPGEVLDFDLFPAL
jgi:hypothetical protein